ARVKEFYIDLREVTHGDYWSKFYVHLESKAEKAAYLPRYIDQREGEKSLWYPDGETGEYLPLPDQMLLPVSGVDWSAAQAYAASQGKRLPTEAEWIAAFASAPGKNEAYPWGNAYIEGLAVDKKAGVSAPLAAEGRLAGRSAFGIYDLSGNVKEWTSTSSEGKDFETVDDIPRGENVCIRGGSYDSNPDSISSGWRWEVPATGSRLADLGFRCAMDAD
ncbi:MAG: SUMF1/EgtB/PvdO family nonheme iron enzyme, partial [Planctomycetes bacterium]|nr:SUMF1/EgtB/PvdO family nonheme iron enzyme [Planctomycetota bacterium]